MISDRKGALTGFRESLRFRLAIVVSAAVEMESALRSADGHQPVIPVGPPRAAQFRMRDRDGAPGNKLGADGLERLVRSAQGQLKDLPMRAMAEVDLREPSPPSDDVTLLAIRVART